MDTGLTNPSLKKQLSVASALRHLIKPAARTSPRMQELITLLARKHQYDLNLDNPNAPQAPLHLKLVTNSKCNLPLVIERRGANLTSVAQMVQADVAGKGWQAMPEIVFFTGNGAWVPVSFQGAPTSFEKCADLNAERNRIGRIERRKQRKAAEFAEEWATELREAGWLTDSERGS